MRLYQNKLLIAIITLLIVGLFVFLQKDLDRNITGSSIMSTKVELLPAVTKNCSTNLYSGWNLVSFNCLGSYVDRSSALTSIDGSYDMIFTYDASDHADPWKSYNPSLPSWAVQQLVALDKFSGYWIYMNTPATFQYSGVSGTASITLYKGWTLTGYPSNNNKSINVSLNGINFTLIESYDNPSDTWLIYVNGSGNNTLANFTPFSGYWINSSSQQTWNVN